MIINCLPRYPHVLVLVHHQSLYNIYVSVSDFFCHIAAFIAHVEPLTDQSSPTTQSTTNIAVASWGEGIVGTSSHELHNKGVVSSRGVQHEVKSSKDLYPSLKPKTPEHHKNITRVTPVLAHPSTEQAATTIQRYCFTGSFKDCHNSGFFVLTIFFWGGGGGENGDVNTIYLTRTDCHSSSVSSSILF